MIGKAKNEGKHVAIECELEQRSGIRIAEKYGVKRVVLSIDWLPIACKGFFELAGVGN